jgi:ABC-type Fe3+/spermidine/putrescine transport system ATPase subunit
MSVEENVRYGLERTGTPDEEIRSRVDEMIELLRLEDIRDRSPGDLSSGQQQRVALARSLVLEPSLLLLDEPLGDLDYKLQKSMEREFLRIHRELDTTFVYVTHDQTQAMRLGDRIVVMNDGQIEQTGSVDDIYNEPATAFVATFVGDTNVFYGTVSSVDGPTATVETEHGPLVASTPTTDGQSEDLLGTEVVLAIRPQLIDLTTDTPNTLECAVEDVIQRPGRGTQVLLTLERESSATTELQLKTDERVDVTAETATIGWEPADSRLLETVSVVEDVDLENDILGE